MYQKRESIEQKMLSLEKGDIATIEWMINRPVQNINSFVGAYSEKPIPNNNETVQRVRR